VTSFSLKSRLSGNDIFENNSHDISAERPSFCKTVDVDAEMYSTEIQATELLIVWQCS